MPDRRTFLKSSLGMPALLWGIPDVEAPSPAERSVVEGDQRSRNLVPRMVPDPDRALDLAPAQWIWYPSQRTLPNTVVLFRRTLDLESAPSQATGWVLGDSRYQLWVNGQRVQWGPAPSDPRFSEADPLALGDYLRAGTNVIGAQVLYYGFGDGTWPTGKPGFLFSLELDDGARRVESDEDWDVHLARAWPPGRPKRWYLRALQEEFDVRKYPNNWTDPDAELDSDRWTSAMVLDGPADKPAICTSYPDYLKGSSGSDAHCQLRRRQVPLMDESTILSATLKKAYRIQWNQPPEDYFDVKPDDAYETMGRLEVEEPEAGTYRFQADPGRSQALTFRLPEQAVGWPRFEIDAPSGTIVEVMVQESHQPDTGPALLNTHFHSWSRLVCGEESTTYEPFDFETALWIQVHVRDAEGPVTVRNVGLRRRRYPWPEPVTVSCSDSEIQEVLEAAVNTLDNCAFETIVDCVGRERQQYSGDIGHTLHALFLGHGEERLPARYVDTFSQGLTQEGYFLDCWPAYDRLNRIAQRQLHLTPWGPLLDHGVQHVIDAWQYHLYTGRTDALEEAYPRHLVFFDYLQDLVTDDGVLEVEDIGTPWVWIDHDAYEAQHHKQCAFTLYTAAMMRRALAPLCRLHDDEERARAAEQQGRALEQAAADRFWSEERGTFVNNLPWLKEEGQPRFCDRSLATAILYDQCPDGQTGPSARLLEERPEALGLSYPANSGWRLWALAEEGRPNAILAELRNRWAQMESVRLNNTLSEGWNPSFDSNAVWSHAPVAPLYVTYMSLAGIRPLEPGFERYEVRPQPGNLDDLRLKAHPPVGPITFHSEGTPLNRSLALRLPADGQGELVLDERETVDLPPAETDAARGRRRYKLPAGERVELTLRHT